MLSSRDGFGVFTVFWGGFVADGVVDGVDGERVGRRDGVIVARVVPAGGTPTAGALTLDTTGSLSAARPNISPSCACHSSSEPTTPTTTTPVTDSNRVRTAPVRRGGRSFVMGYSLSDRGGRHIGPRDRPRAPQVAPEYQFGR
jgi:hypothetical protein